MTNAENKRSIRYVPTFKGHHFSEEQRKKISEALKGRPRDKDSVEKISNV